MHYQYNTTTVIRPSDINISDEGAAEGQERRGRGTRKQEPLLRLRMELTAAVHTKKIVNTRLAYYHFKK